MHEEQLAALVGLLRPARRILAITGAGISTSSKIPDYRGPAGVYRDRSPVYYQDFIASESARREYWSFKVDGYAAFRDAKPNSAHHALVELEARGQLALVVTQNVDGLHQLSGLSSERLVELHGNNREVECDTCGQREEPDRCMTYFSETGEPPRCLGCGGLMKPAVVMFGQPLASENLHKAQAASRAADLVLALGSSLVVTPAADIPLFGVRNGAGYVIINQGQTPHDHLATLRIDGDVSEYLPAAVSRLVKLV
jgi:NAD-dependent deacetylase